MFCTRLKELRTEHNLTQKALATHLGLSSNCICEWEKGRAEPSLEALKKLSTLFCCSIDYIVGNCDELGVIALNSQTAELSPDGKELLDIYNALAPEYKAQILEYARYFQERTKGEKNGRRQQG